MLLWQAVSVAQALSSSPPSSSACNSPLFRQCPGSPSCASLDKVHQEPSANNLKVNVSALQALGYPEGFCRALVQGAQIYAKRYWIIDDSLSMMTRDGHFLLHSGPDCDERLEMVPGSRWNELQETCLQHALLAVHLEIHTDFRLLNCGTGHFRIPRTFGHHRKRASMDDVQHAQKILSRAKPRGVTPLTKRLASVRKELEQSVLPKLPRGQKVAIILATDGLPTNPDQHGFSTDQAKEEFRLALQDLPADQVSVVVRLCTDDVAVVDYYNALEAELTQVQVLDDYWAEATRVHKLNPWLNYGLVLHRVREMGCCGHVPLLKMLSQRKLAPAEVAEFCQFLFHLPPEESLPWEHLIEQVERGNLKEGLVWNPMRSRMEPWIDLEKY